MIDLLDIDDNSYSKRAILTVGVSCSGKTTWAEEFVQNHPHWVIICRDTIREEVLYDIKKQHPFTWDKWDWKWEKEVNKVQLERITFAKNSSLVEGIILADTNLNKKSRIKIHQTLEDFGFAVSYVYFHIPWDEAVKRDTLRRNGVGVSVLAKQFSQYHAQFSRQYLPEEVFPPAIIVDLDGTLAKKSPERGTFEWQKVHLDTPNTELVYMLKGLQQQQYKLIFVSGRDSACRQLTYEWITQQGLVPEKLLMRKHNDFRSDCIVKEELFWEHISNYYHVKLVIDDRPKVCRMWRKLNLPVLQYGNPYIEF